MNGWKVSVPLVPSGQELLLRETVDKIAEDEAFSVLWGCQKLDNNCISGETEVTLTVDELRKVAAFWMGMGIGAKCEALHQEQVVKGLQSA